MGLAEIGLTLFVGIIVEEVKTSAEAEDGMGEPIGGGLELAYGEGGLVAVIDLAGAACKGEFESPRGPTPALPT